MDTEAISRLLAIAAKQFGIFTTAQATECRVSRSTIRTNVANGVWVRVHRGVYFVGGHDLSQPAVHFASVAAGVEGTRCSHRAAAWLWGLTPHPQRPEITTIGARSRIAGVRCHYSSLPLGPPEHRRGIAVTSAAETVLDLGAVVILPKVRDALDRGIANRVLTPHEALDELVRRGDLGARGSAVLRKLIDDAGVSGSHPPSVLEAHTRRLIAAAGLTQPECELTVGERGHYRLDFCWPDLMFAIEVDGWQYHSSTDAFVGNKTRKNALTVLGYTILEYTWIHVRKTPKTTIAEIRAVYTACQSRSLAPNGG